MKIIKFEGTAEEFAIASRFFEDRVNGENVEPLEQTLKPEEETKKKAERKAAYKNMLNRIPISEGQMDLYRVLSKGEMEYGEYLTKMNRDSKMIAGLHGALGKRINATDGIKESGLPGNSFAVMTWKNERGQGLIGLKPEFIEVLIEEKII